MAKKRQTSSLPRPREVVTDEAEGKTGKQTPLREYKSRAERETETQRRIIWGTGIAIGLIIVIVGIAFFFDEVITPSQRVLEVNGETVSVAEFEKQVRLERALVSERISAAARVYLSNGETTDPNTALNLAVEQEPELLDEFNDLGVADLFGQRVLDRIVEDILIRQEAERLGLGATDEEIDQAVEQFLRINRDEDPLLAGEGFEPEPDPTPTNTPIVPPTNTPQPTVTPTTEASPVPTLTPVPTTTPQPTLTADERLQTIDDEVAAFYRSVGNQADVDRADIRDYFEGQVLRRKLAEALSEPESGEAAIIWANARIIQLDTEDNFPTIIEALNTGESFMALAQVNSSDFLTAGRGGEMGWVNTEQVAGDYGEAVAEALRTQDVRQINTEPIQGEDGVYIIQVRDREERDASEEDIERQQEETIQEWLDALLESEDTEIEQSSDWFDYVPELPVFFTRF